MLKISQVATEILDDLAVLYLQKKARRYANEMVPKVVFSHDFVSSHIAVRGLYEREQLEYLQPIIEKFGREGAVLDVGANLGNHTLFFSQFSAEVHAFEPNPITAAVLALNTRGSPRVTVHRYGLSDVHHFGKAYVPMTNMGGTTIGREGHRECEQIAIELRTYTDCADQIELPIGIIKIDVEGHEKNVISGLTSCLRTDRPLILFESNYDDTDGGNNGVQVIEMLRNLGYDMFHEVALPRSRVSQRLPRLIRWPLRSVEKLFQKFRNRVRLIPIVRIDNRSYEMIVASCQRKHGLSS